MSARSQNPKGVRRSFDQTSCKTRVPMAAYSLPPTSTRESSRISNISSTSELVMMRGGACAM